jgi:hypothetical protein
LPALPSNAVLHEMMSFSLGQTVPADDFVLIK